MTRVPVPHVGAKYPVLRLHVSSLHANVLCCWGPGCERLHDCFDEADVCHKLDDADAPVVMTTWHDRESLDSYLHTGAPVPDEIEQ